VQDKNVRVIYTGDISLRTSRHDFATTLLDLVSSEQKTVVLLDATMAGREAGASSSAPAELLTDQYGEVVVVAESAEHLLYAYLDLYFAVQHCASRNTVSFICSSSMRPMFQILHRPFIKREYETLDPFISAQYGRSMSAWAESRWLYWLDKSGTLPEGRRFWFIPLSEFDPGMFVSDATFLFIGRPDRAPVDQRFAAIDTTPWTLHTADSGLADATRTLLGVGARVALFHNMTKRAQKFLSAHGLAGEVIRSSSALDLRE
jgi:hypothetical protein